MSMARIVYFYFYSQTVFSYGYIFTLSSITVVKIELQKNLIYGCQ